MQMHVMHGLSTVRTSVDHDAKTVVEMLLLSDFIRRQEEFAEKFSVCGAGVSKRGHMSFGDDQQVDRRLWINVWKCEDILILVDARDRNYTLSDLAEEAIRVGSHERMLNPPAYFLKYFGSISGIHGSYALPNAARRPMEGWL